MWYSDPVCNRGIYTYIQLFTPSHTHLPVNSLLSSLLFSWSPSIFQELLSYYSWQKTCSISPSRTFAESTRDPHPWEWTSWWASSYAHCSYRCCLKCEITGPSSPLSLRLQEIRARSRRPVNRDVQAVDPSANGVRKSEDLSADLYKEFLVYGSLDKGINLNHGCLLAT